MRLPVLAAVLTLSQPAAAADLPGAAWLATAAGGLSLSAADEVTIDFAEGRIAGRSGCNRYSGAVTLTALTPAAGRLQIGPVMGTRMACIGRGNEVEAAFLAALAGVDGWQIERDGSLVLTGGGAALIRAEPR